MRIKRSLIAIIATACIAGAPLAAPAQFSVGVGFSVGYAPPAIPVYVQPAAPYPNWQWTPGYWGWGPAGYYWVPGVWVAPPSIGVYWTPGYWGYGGGGYGWNAGYWGPRVGFYGGINYGFGYYGAGFVGGFWSGGAFRYNTAVVNVNRTVIRNVYVNKTVIHNNYSHTSYNGGRGGVTARPTSADIATRRSGIAPTTAQRSQAQIAAQDRNLYANVNKGKPPVTASAKPFSSTNRPPNFAPVTTADRQNAQKPAGGANNAQSKPAGGTTQSKPAGGTTQSKPANQTKPNNAPVSQPKHNAAASQPKHNAPASQPKHKQPAGGQMHSQGGKPPGGGGKPPGGGGGKPPGGGGGKPPGGGDKGKPPRR